MSSHSMGWPSLSSPMVVDDVPEDHRSGGGGVSVITKVQTNTHWCCAGAIVSFISNNTRL